MTSRKHRLDGGRCWLCYEPVDDPNSECPGFRFTTPERDYEDITDRVFNGGCLDVEAITGEDDPREGRR